MKKSPCFTMGKRLDWPTHVETPILGHGIYTLSEAARLVHTTPRRLGAWFYGWPGGAVPITHSDYDTPTRCSRLISFLDLIDALVVAELRRTGAPLQFLRKVQAALAKELNVSHPFCHKNLYTHGRSVFIETADKFGNETLKDLLKKQQVFRDVLRPFIHEVLYARETLTAMCWRPCPGVVIDPQRQFGKPIVAAVGIPTSILAAAYRANKSNGVAVAEWYCVEQKDVETAVRFETEWVEAAA